MFYYELKYPMAHPCEVINPLHRGDWDALLHNTPGASFFHTSAWSRVLYDSYGYLPVFAAHIVDGGFAALLPVMEVASFLTGRRGVALPFCDNCEPILPRGTGIMDILPCMLAYGERHGWQSLIIKQQAYSLGDQAPWQRYVLHRLALSADINRLFAGFKSATRRNIKKALTLSVAITMGATPEDLRAYYHLHCRTRRRHGIPPQPFAFFRNIHKHVLAKDLGLIINARHNNMPVAGAIFFRYQDRAYYKYGAYDLRYQHLRAFNLVMATAIRHFAESGCTSLCFGRTEPENHGLLQFKNGWNSEVVPLNYYRYNFRRAAFERERPPPHNVSKALQIAMFRTMPAWCLKTIGNIFYRHIA